MMKHLQSPETEPHFDKVILDKILAIEKDVLVLKLSIMRKLDPSKKKLAKLKGIVPAVTITDKDILSAKSSLYDKVEI